MSVAAFDPMLGKPSWSVSKGHGSFITMEFGEPLLAVDDEPREATHSFVGGEKLRVLRRQAHVHGEWHLWVYCCEWLLTASGRRLAHYESDEISINRALSVLNGQALTSVTVDEERGGSRFHFDLGCLLSTRPEPAGTYTEEPIDQWKLFQPSGSVLALRSDGSYEISR